MITEEGVKSNLCSTPLSNIPEVRVSVLAKGKFKLQIFFSEQVCGTSGMFLLSVKRLAAALPPL